MGLSGRVCILRLARFLHNPTVYFFELPPPMRSDTACSDKELPLALPHEWIDRAMTLIDSLLLQLGMSFNIYIIVGFPVWWQMFAGSIRQSLCVTHFFIPLSITVGTYLCCSYNASVTFYKLFWTVFLFCNFCEYDIIFYDNIFADNQNTIIKGY